MTRYDDFRFLARTLTPPNTDDPAGEALCDEIGRMGRNWEGVIELASRHLVTPTLYWSLDTKGLLGALPPDVHRYLETVYELNGERNRRITHQLQQLVQALADARIKTVLLKGTSHLAENLYDNSACRMIGDIDILVPPWQIEDALQVLVRIGYHEADGGDASLYKGHHHYVLHFVF